MVNETYVWHCPSCSRELISEAPPTGAPCFACAEVCPVCDGEVERSVDERGDKWDTCRACREVFVTAAHLNSPTMRYPLPEDEQAYEVVRAEARCRG